MLKQQRVREGLCEGVRFRQKQGRRYVETRMGCPKHPAAANGIINPPSGISTFTTRSLARRKLVCITVGPDLLCGHGCSRSRGDELFARHRIDGSGL